MFYTVLVEGGDYFEEYVMLVDRLSSVPGAIRKLGKEIIENHSDESFTYQDFEKYTLNIEKTEPWPDQQDFYPLDGANFWEVMDNQTKVVEVYNGEIKDWSCYNV